MSNGWSSVSIGRRTRWFVPLLAAAVAFVMVPLVGAGAVQTEGESATQGVCVAQLDRLWGADRYATAVEISKSTFPGGAGTVFIATGENFPDALAASTLAHKLGGPVLLTRTGTLPGITINEIKRLKATKIKILGGTAAVQTTVENTLKSLGSVSVSRIWGSDRYATAAQISKAAFPNASSVKLVYVAVGTSFPDALGAAPVGALASAPLLLTGPTSLSGPTRQEILRLAPEKVVVVGGGISSSVRSAIAALGPVVTTIAGSDRFATAVAVSKHGFPSGASTVFIARGSTFPDALAGGVAAADAGGPILLVNETSLPASVANELKRLAPDRVVILGGTAAVSSAVALAAQAAACGQAPPPPDTKKPVIKIVGPNPRDIFVGSTYNDNGATADDNVDGDISGKIVVVSTVNAAVIGTYKVTYNVSDAAGNPANTKMRVVNVIAGIDNVKPTIKLTGPSPTLAPLGSVYVDRGATATDDIDGDISNSIIVDQTAVNTAVAGLYVVTFDVSDAAGNPADQKTRTVEVVGITAASQVNKFLTGYKGPVIVPENRLTVPSTDPAGITVGPANRLFIVDSEIAEPNLADAFADAGGNVFEVSLDGSTLYNVYDLNNTEPTGIAYEPGADVFYVTNDDTKTLYRYSFTAGVGFTLLDSISTSAAGFSDVEGVTVDGSGNIYVIAQSKKTILVYTYTTVFTLVKTLDLAVLNPGVPVPNSPEGIAFDSASGNLFVVSSKDLPYAVFEYTTAGVDVARYSLKTFSPLPAFGTPEHNLKAVKAPQGLTFGPASAGGSTSRLYIADGGVDNGSGSIPTNERDGVIYEGSLG